MTIDFAQLALSIKNWGRELGFQQLGITDTDLQQAEQRLQQWLAKGYHGSMDYMARHGTKRTRPQELVPGTLRIISARMDYLPPDTHMATVLADSNKGYISRYALGRDYHKLIRKRLQKLAQRIEQEVGEFNYRAFADSAPVMEKPLAVKAGLGWQGKHTVVINRQAGSWFFIGTLYTDLPLPLDSEQRDHCGSCRACMDVCPTQAIVAPYQLDARRCISYLTIELKGAIPVEFRPLIGNRVFGCDDCQLVCPWNRFAQSAKETAFHARHGLGETDLLSLFNWDEATYLRFSEGSALRRVGYQGWLRNVAVALGNAPASSAIMSVLQQRRAQVDDLVAEHIDWALARQQALLK